MARYRDIQQAVPDVTLVPGPGQAKKDVQDGDDNETGMTNDSCHPQMQKTQSTHRLPQGRPANKVRRANSHTPNSRQAAKPVSGHGVTSEVHRQGSHVHHGFMDSWSGLTGQLMLSALASTLALTLALADELLASLESIHQSINQSVSHPFRTVRSCPPCPPARP
jgi:hypothetical protein